jgi:hypothetical protein
MGGVCRTRVKYKECIKNNRQWMRTFWRLRRRWKYNIKVDLNDNIRLWAALS